LATAISKSSCVTCTLLSRRANIPASVHTAWTIKKETFRWINTRWKDQWCAQECWKTYALMSHKWLECFQKHSSLHICKNVARLLMQWEFKQEHSANFFKAQHFDVAMFLSI
jgi:hypothetical protein